MREKKGLSQNDLAQALHVQRSVISKYENGIIEPALWRLRQIAEALGIEDLADLVSESKDKSAQIGRWLPQKARITFLYCDCSACGAELFVPVDGGEAQYEFCPYCGTKMSEALP